jgi:hypothetical protein
MSETQAKFDAKADRLLIMQAQSHGCSEEEVLRRWAEDVEKRRLTEIGCAFAADYLKRKAVKQ